MSLTNADSYKNNREKRKKEAKKKKLLFRLKTALAAVIVVLICVWIGYSGYQKIEENKPRASVTADYTAFDDYLSGLSNAEAAEQNRMKKEDSMVSAILFFCIGNCVSSQGMAFRASGNCVK